MCADTKLCSARSRPQARSRHAWGSRERQHVAYFTGRLPACAPGPCRFFSGSGANLQVLGGDEDLSFAHASPDTSVQRGGPLVSSRRASADSDELSTGPRRYNWPQETEARRQRASVDLVRPAAPFPLCAWQSLPSSRASTPAAQIDCQIFESYPTLRRELMQVLG